MKNDKSFPFADAPNTASFVCCHVLNYEKPILMVTHDDDGYWQFLCGKRHTEQDARIISLMDAYKLDHSIGVLSNMDYGETAERKDTDSEWIIR